MRISEVVERACRLGLIRDEPPLDVATVIIATADGAVVSTEISLKALCDLDRVSLGRAVERMVQARERVLRGESLGAESHL